MSSTAAMPMPMLVGTVAPDARVLGSWRRPAASASVMCHELGHPIAHVTSGTDLNQAKTFTKAYGDRRPLEPST
jgi:hypothetical protein